MATDHGVLRITNPAAQQFIFSLLDGLNCIEKLQWLGNPPNHIRIDDYWLASGRWRLFDLRCENAHPRIESVNLLYWKRPLEMHARLDERTSRFTEGSHQTGLRISNLERDQIETERDNDESDKDCYGYVLHFCAFSSKPPIS